MTDDDIKRLAAPHLSTPDSRTPQIRGWDDLIAFAYDVLDERRPECVRPRVLEQKRPLYLPLTEAD